MPIIADERVVGVLLAATSVDYHAFTPDEIALLETLAGEVALVLDRMRSADALSVALGREQAVAAIARAVREERDVDALLRIASQKLREELMLDRISIDVEDNRPKIVFERAQPLDAGERFLLETVTSEIGVALETARLLAENQRRIEQQGALLHAAKVVASELEVESVLERLVGELRTLLRVDAVDCYLLDSEGTTLRCAAVNGFDASLVGFEFEADRGAAGLAMERERPGCRRCLRRSRAPDPPQAYRGFALRARCADGLGRRGSRGTRRRDALRRSCVCAGETSICSRRSPGLPRSRFETPRVSPSARVSRVSSAPSRGSLSLLSGPVSRPRPSTPPRTRRARRSAAISLPF